MHTRGEVKAELIKLLGESFHRRFNPSERVYITAYQLFNKVSDTMQQQLAGAHGPSGRGAGWFDSGAKAISKMLVEMPTEVESIVVDTSDMQFVLAGQGVIEPGSRYGCAAYRLIKP